MRRGGGWRRRRCAGGGPRRSGTWRRALLLAAAGWRRRGRRGGTDRVLLRSSEEVVVASAAAARAGAVALRRGMFGSTAGMPWPILSKHFCQRRFSENKLSSLFGQFCPLCCVPHSRFAQMGSQSYSSLK
jgi:hypothetical protein